MRRLSVRLSGAFGELNITNQISDLSYRSEAIGGFKSASFRLSRPIHQNSPELAPLNKVYVYDARSPRKIAWQGYLEDPGRAADSRGFVWTVNAVGPSARLKDAASPICYVDRRLDQWRRGENDPDDGPSTQFWLSVEKDTPQGFDNPAWKLKLNNPSTTGANTDVGGIVYELLKDSGQHIARFNHVFAMGKTEANWHYNVGASGGGGFFSTDVEHEWNINGVNSSPVIGTHFDTDRNMLWVFVRRVTSSSSVSDDITWVLIVSLVVQGTRYTKAGVEKVSGSDYPQNYIFAHDVVADILGRWCPTFDRANANIATTSFAIEQFAYTDPVRPADILADLTELEPEYRWSVWGDTHQGLNEFEYVKWTDGDVLEYDPADGFTSPESASDMYSDVTVRYDDGTGKIRNHTATQTVTALQGIRRYGIVNLASERGVTQAMRERAAEAFLTESVTPSRSGTLTVARPIFNTTRGVMVEPWLIRPGALLRLKGIQARPDFLNNSDHNGVTMFRVVSTEYSATSGMATLELEGFFPTVARLVAGEMQYRTHFRTHFFSFT